MISLEITTDKLIRMMKFLNKRTFVIQFYNLELPRETCIKNNYRNEKIFHLRDDGTLNYRGWGGPEKGTVEIENVEFPQLWKNRAFIQLSNDVRSEIRQILMHQNGPENADELILKFNKLEFIGGIDDDI